MIMIITIDQGHDDTEKIKIYKSTDNLVQYLVRVRHISVPNNDNIVGLRVTRKLVQHVLVQLQEPYRDSRFHRRQSYAHVSDFTVIRKDNLTFIRPGLGVGEEGFFDRRHQHNNQE